MKRREHQGRGTHESIKTSPRPALQCGSSSGGQVGVVCRCADYRYWHGPLANSGGLRASSLVCDGDGDGCGGRGLFAVASEWRGVQVNWTGKYWQAG